MPIKNPSKIICICLIASLGFNVFFLLGYFKTKQELKLSKTRMGRLQLMENKLGLNEEQSKKFREINKARMMYIKSLHDKSKPQLDDFWAEVAKENPDKNKIDQIIESSLSDVDKARRQSMRSILQLMKYLNYDQRQKLIQIIRKDKMR